ncbi:hypothetical protein [Spongiactinospora sp. TRM90649]|uniref:hypothetical protein n=1 Tax=Spongiactinospora sp. TRM90649 TaxID=3031114 RepID=UPI0023F8999F|nr:hypothetical protein [Spongiactinospora sp. TRM90649]MDF5758025.1 hypothetical protein [Spongiactinospora sp. TRM90649]
MAPADASINEATGSRAAAPFQLRHVQSGRCLDGSVSQGIRLNTCNDNGYQAWR